MVGFIGCLGAAVKMEHFQAALDPRKQELLEARFLGARVSFEKVYFFWENSPFLNVFVVGVKHTPYSYVIQIQYRPQNHKCQFQSRSYHRNASIPLNISTFIIKHTQQKCKICVFLLLCLLYTQGKIPFPYPNNTFKRICIYQMPFWINWASSRTQNKSECGHTHQTEFILKVHKAENTHNYFSPQPSWI